MTSLNDKVVKLFCDNCNWAYEVWCTHKTLFDNNPNKDQLMKSDCQKFFSRLSIITQEYVLLQITKLHDPPVMGGNICLTIGYIIEYGGWNKETYDKLKKIFSLSAYLPTTYEHKRKKFNSIPVNTQYFLRLYIQKRKHYQPTNESKNNVLRLL